MAQRQPSVTITEQPANTYRFRYRSEIEKNRNRSIASIKGVSSSEAVRSYPTIQINGYEGPFVVRISLVTAIKNLVHPHSIESSKKQYLCNNGVIYYFADKPTVQFSDIGIVRVKGNKSQDDITKALKIRRNYKIDPFEAGFGHINNHHDIDLSAVRLCFEVLLRSQDWTPADLRVIFKYNGGKLPPVASDVIYDKKKYNELKIIYFAGPVIRLKEMHLWCKKYTGEDPDVVFEDADGWSEKAENVVIHQKAAMKFDPPRYEQRSSNCVRVKVQLRHTNQSGEQTCSEPVFAEYTWRYPKVASPDYLPNISAKQTAAEQLLEECRSLVDFKEPTNNDADEASNTATVNSPVDLSAPPNVDHPMSINISDFLEYGSHDLMSEDHIDAINNFDDNPLLF